jgi:hypothetical protein
MNQLQTKIWIRNPPDIADWTELVDVLPSPPPTWEAGLPGTNVMDLVAGTGILTFYLDNGLSNSAGLLGLFSPAHANLMAGFAEGAQIAVTVVEV